MKSSHLRWFDAARGIAAIAVLIAHSNQVFLARFTRGTDTLSIILGTGAEYAVYAFFFMSGYLITLSIRNNIRNNGRFDSFEYASSRIARIYPPLAGAILIVISVGLVIRTFHLPDLDLPGRARYTFDFYEIWTALTMRSGLGISDGALWSLYIEGQIYIIAGGLAMIGWSRKIAPVLIGIVAVYVGIKLQKNEWFLFYGAIWLAGSLASLVRISRELHAPPRWLMATGGFSYSLYVIHFPLLLLAWSIAQTSNTTVNAATMLVSAVAILPVAYVFSILFERAAAFKNASKFHRIAIDVDQRRGSSGGRNVEIKPIGSPDG